MGGFNGGLCPPDAEKWVFISRRLNFRVGGKNISKINNFRIIGQSKLQKLLEKEKSSLNYYYLLLLKIYFLKLFDKFEIAYEIYKEKENEIKKLPLDLKIKFELLFADAFIKKYPNLALKIVSKLEKIKKDIYLKDDLFRAYINLGNLNKARKLIYEPILEFLMGNYKNFIKEALKFLDKIEDAKTYYKSLLIESKIFNNIPFSIISKEVENEIKKYPIYKINYNGTLALKFAIEGDYNKVRELLSPFEETSNIIRAILTHNDKILSKYRKQELLVNYLIKGNLKRAVELARKYGLIYNLHLYSILLNKSIKRLKRYKEFRNVVNLIRKNRKFKLKVYILKKSKEFMLIINSLEIQRDLVKCF